MRRRNEKTSADLTEGEIAVLRSQSAPAEVRRYLARQHEDVGAKTSAYRKVAAAARAEREALMEVHALNVVRAKLGDDAQRVEAEDLRALEATNAELQYKLRTLTAAPAMAVYSNE